MGCHVASWPVECRQMAKQGARWHEYDEDPSAGVEGKAAVWSRVVRQVKVGFPYSRLAKFQKDTQFSWEGITVFVAIPQRTLNRRRAEGRLRPEESDRLWRGEAIFAMVVDLFDGDIAAAREWLQTPQRGLGGQIPLDVAATAVGAREIERLVGRLEHGVVA